MRPTITIRYFAQLRERAGRTEEDIAIEPGDTAATLFNRVAETYTFPLGIADVRVAINDAFAPVDRTLNAGDQIAFIPPVSGG